MKNPDYGGFGGEYPQSQTSKQSRFDSHVQLQAIPFRCLSSPGPGNNTTLPECYHFQNHGSSGDLRPEFPTEKKTIYALSMPPGRGGIGAIRVSGSDALDVYS